VCASPAFVADEWSIFGEQLVAHASIAERRDRLIPLLLQPCELPLHIEFRVHLDCTDEANWENEMARLRRLLDQPEPEAERLPCPYPGMVPFSEHEARHFFGREQEIEMLRRRLRHHNYLFVIGPSGSGKSSLVFAGLIPALHQQQPGEWLIKIMRPGNAPMSALARVLNSPLASVSNPAALGKIILTQNFSAKPLLLIIDQFEELFTQNSRPVETAFIAAIKALRQVENCFLVLTMRSDFFHNDLMRTALWPVASGERLEIAPLAGEALLEAIAKPAENLGVYLEIGLLERLLADVEADEQPGVLPLVQETMALLWEKKQRRFISLRTYESLGEANRSGLAVALATKADAAFAQLNAAQQAIARRIFLRLVQFGEGRADTRRQQPVASLRSTGENTLLFEQTLRHLTENRLLTLSGEEGEADRKVDLAHEVLITSWPILIEWLAERREAEQMRRRLETKATEWVRLGWGEGGLLDETELREAERWLASSDAVDLGYDAELNGLVITSRAAIALAEHEKEMARQSQLQRLRRFLTAFAILFLVALGAAAVAYFLKFKSDRLRRFSIVQMLVAEATRQTRQGRHERGALLARQAYLFNQRHQLRALPQVDAALREVLSVRYFSAALRVSSDWVLSVAFSPDGQTLAAGSADGAVRLWDLRQPHRVPVVLRGPFSAINSVAFSPNGQTLAAGSADGIIRIWNLQQPDPDAMLLRGHRDEVNAVAFHANGRMLASASMDGTIRLWNLDQLDSAANVQLNHKSGVNAVTFSPDGKILASGSTDGTVCFWDWNHPADPPKIFYEHSLAIRCLAFSSDGRKLVIGTGDVEVHLFDLSQPSTAPQLLRGHQSGIRSVAFSSAGQTLASAGEDRTIRLWKLGQTDSALVVLQGHEGWVRSVAFSPDERMLASGSSDGTIRLWELSLPPAVPITLRGHTGPVKSVAFSSDGLTLASGSYDATVRLWRFDQPDRHPTILKAHEFGVEAVAFSPDDRRLASGSADHTVRLWDLSALHTEPAVLRGHEAAVLTLAFSQNGKWLASGSLDWTVRLWDMRQPATSPRVFYGNGFGFGAVAFSRDGDKLAAGSGDGIISLWNLFQFPADSTSRDGYRSSINALAFDPDSRTLAAAGTDKTIRLGDFHESRAGTIILRGHEASVLSVSFSSDGRTLASSSADKTLRLWDWRHPETPPIILRGYESAVNSVVFSPDGQRLASGSDDGTIHIWIASTETLADMVCEKVRRNLTFDEWNQFIGADIPYEPACPELPY
jgi:WD40 repeat protein